MWTSAGEVWIALSTALPFTAVALLVLGHVHANKTQFRAVFGAWQHLTGKVIRADRPPDFQLRFNEELFVARCKMIENMAALIIHLALLFCLGEAWKFLRDPSISTLCPFLASLLTYAWVNFVPGMVKSQMQFRLFEATLIFIGSLHVIGLSYERDVTRFDASERVALLGTITTSILVIDYKVIMPFYVCQSAVLVYSRWCLIGFAKLTPYVILMEVISYSALGGGMVFAVRNIQSNIEAKLDSSEVASLMQGFRQVLRGVCDGDLILDRRTMTIVDDASCLERVLKSSNRQFSNRNFLDFFLDSESRQKFSKFLEATGTEFSMPRGLKVSLQGARGPVSMDLFCTALPRGGSPSDYCLLAMKEDPLEQLQTAPPEAPANSAPERIQQPRTELLQRSTSRTSTSSRSSRSSLRDIVVPYDDLTEIALLISDVTGLLDIEQVHLSFVRKSSVSKIESGMPTLRKFIRPSDWDRLERMLSTVTNLPPPDQQESCYFRRPTYFRMPGETGKYLCARYTSLRLAESIVPGRPSHFWMHLGNFDANIRRLREGQLEDIEEEQ